MLFFISKLMLFFQIQADGNPAMELQKAEVSVLSNSLCSSYWGPYILDQHICVRGYDTPEGTGICNVRIRIYECTLIWLLLLYCFSVYNRVCLLYFFHLSIIETDCCIVYLYIIETGCYIVSLYIIDWLLYFLSVYYRD